MANLSTVTRSWCLAALIGVTVVAAVVVLRWRRMEPSADSSPSLAGSTTNGISTEAQRTTDRTGSSASSPPAPARSGFDRVRAAPDATEVRRILAEWRTALASAPRDQAVNEIRAALATGADAPTGLAFRLANDGTLAEAPTVRTFLLDALERLDRAAAAEYARGLLAGKSSADEWAVALRSLARGDASVAGRALLQSKLEEMLGEPAWRREPTTGFLEAFDVAVFLGGTRLVPTLTDLVQDRGNPALARASYLALDRLTIHDPVTMLAVLQAAPESWAGREETRASYFARGDVRDSAQRLLLETYLADPRLSAREWHAFAGQFPQANFMISANLLTQNRTLDHASLVARDAESLNVVNQWRTDPRFARFQPELDTIARRLEQFARQAQAPSPR